jgi:ribonuclease HII
VGAALIPIVKRIPKGLTTQNDMTPEARQEAYTRIVAHAIAVGVGERRWNEIDLVNIRQATHLAMARACARSIPAAFALVDGNDAPALPCRGDTLVDGEARSVYDSPAQRPIIAPR